MEMEMKRTLAILAPVTSCAVAQAEGPAAGPSSQTGCASVPAKDLKPDSGKNVTNLPKNEHAASQNAAPTSSDCKQKQEKAEHPDR
jgi:hypothetical protein